MSTFPSEFFHGSPLRLELLRAGSTVTPLYDLARVFSHKPSIVSIDEREGVFSLAHNGTASGWIYQVSGVTDQDVFPHPNSSMGEGLEWITRRDLPLKLIGPVEIRLEEYLSKSELLKLGRKR